MSTTTSFRPTAFLLTLALALPSVMGHMAMWHPSVYGFNGPPEKMIEPLHSMGFSRWWFHGDLTPTGEVYHLPSGGTANVELACGKQHTQWGGAPAGMNSPCPSDVPAAHAGPNPTDDVMRGCGLAIAYKSNVRDVTPGDFVVFSVNHLCVKHRVTQFAVPAGMPPCPNGKCVCAWFWQGLMSNDEMYMNGFDCTIDNPGNEVIAQPKPARACHGNPGGCEWGAKQPMYWANEGSNIQHQGRDRLPAYQDSWGFPNGAQNIFVRKQKREVKERRGRYNLAAVKA